MMDQKMEKCSSEDDDPEKRQDKQEDVTADPEFVGCMLQPCSADSDPNYVGIRRLLLFRKVQSGLLHRKVDWRCNGKGYVAYRNFINRRGSQMNLRVLSYTSSPGTSGQWAPSPGPASLTLEVDSWSAGRDTHESQTLSHTNSLGSNLSETDHPRRKAEPAYSFVGMHCIFDQCKAMDFDFTMNNQYIASSSLDKTVRVWDIPRGLCIRVIYGVAPQLCIRFHPVNNNFLSVGNANREISVFNFSTGRLIDKTVVDSKVTAMDYDNTGRFIFCGDAQGWIYTITVNSHQGTLSRSHRARNSSKHKSEVTTIQYRTFSLLTRGPVLLSFSRDGSLSFFSVSLELQGYLTLRCSLKLAPRLHSIRASFCPLLSLEKGEFIVAGSEDASVYFYDLTRPKHTCVNKLQGHGCPVIGVAWNHGENLLASSDYSGTVIVWKRAKTNEKSRNF
ncbi:WD repeat-containing protein 13-like isoform X3 [Cynara cardunculus var. scolymus]|uniref:WD repeat-containing protein 13-like isoform X3 n=1 Tax=Cynara cardunculus var. scolymus TaxID=59895 RepID=UPI000D627533|nr:WD repeat-containing protein 13-like isoform X3 [Cynara cardunculus var. scolymus]